MHLRFPLRRTVAVSVILRLAWVCFSFKYDWKSFSIRTCGSASLFLMASFRSIDILQFIQTVFLLLNIYALSSLLLLKTCYREPVFNFPLSVCFCRLEAYAGCITRYKNMGIVSLHRHCGFALQSSYASLYSERGQVGF